MRTIQCVLKNVENISIESTSVQPLSIIPTLFTNQDQWENLNSIFVGMGYGDLEEQRVFRGSIENAIDFYNIKYNRNIKYKSWTTLRDEICA
jgi:hypothetical protein